MITRGTVCVTPADVDDDDDARNIIVSTNVDTSSKHEWHLSTTTTTCHQQQAGSNISSSTGSKSQCLTFTEFTWDFELHNSDAVTLQGRDVVARQPHFPRSLPAFSRGLAQWRSQKCELGRRGSARHLFPPFPCFPFLFILLLYSHLFISPFPLLGSKLVRAFGGALWAFPFGSGTEPQP